MTVIVTRNRLVLALVLVAVSLILAVIVSGLVVPVIGVRISLVRVGMQDANAAAPSSRSGGLRQLSGWRGLVNACTCTCPYTYTYT